MSKCLTCGEPIEQIKGKRKRIYCSDLCKLRHWQRNNKRPATKPTEVKSPKTQDTPDFKKDQQSAVTEPKNEVDLERENILEQIKLIKAEKIPPNRDTLYGKKSWNLEQSNRIKELENILNQI